MPGSLIRNWGWFDSNYHDFAGRTRGLVTGLISLYLVDSSATPAPNLGDKMCLMCEWYIDSCDKPECIEAAEQRYENAKASGDRQQISSAAEELYVSRSDWKLFLWKGYSEPCEHIREGHGPHCAVVKRQETEYGLLYDSCNCDWLDGSWVYY